MKLNIKNLSAAGLLAAAISMGSCTDRIAFGNEFLEKAPGGVVTADTVFSNAEYTRQFLAATYRSQYYNLPSLSTNAAPQCLNYWKGMPDALGDTHQLFFTNTQVFGQYYNGALTSSADGNRNYNIFPYDNERVWENVRQCNLMLENVDKVPGLTDKEKAHIKDEARCLLASNYYNAFRWFGGLPIIDKSFNGDESSYEGRATARETIDFMVGLLDEVIASKNLEWGYDENAIRSEAGRWTLAGAMALKCEILQFAASPLLNSDRPYFDGKYSVERPELTWLGGYDAGMWTKFYNACKDFFDALSANGIYHLQQPEGNTQEDYRFAFRYAYLREGSPESLHSIRIATKAQGNDYNWYNLGWGGAADGSGTNDRMSYCPTQEYVEMFPWADGRPFNWEEAMADGSVNKMFVEGDTVKGEQYLQNLRYTRDPRLYETAGVNGAQIMLNWDNGSASGQPWEAWVGGTSAGPGPANNAGVWGNGYRNLKYIVGECMRRQFPQWNYLTLSRMYLNYAEAIIQNGGSCAEAVKYVDAVRARVGLKGIVESNPGKNMLVKDVLLEEILRERACEGALDLVRYFDMIRYKRADLFERKLHGLRIYRMSRYDASNKKVGADAASFTWKRDDSQWYNMSFNKPEVTETNPDFYQPSYFTYERFEITSGARKWWKDGFDPKWYFQPLPLAEVMKGYGLDQNAGW